MSPHLHFCDVPIGKLFYYSLGVFCKLNERTAALLYQKDNPRYSFAGTEIVTLA